MLALADLPASLTPVKNPTASGLERALACPAYVVLPHVNESGEDAERGNQIHGFIRNVAARMPREEALVRLSPEHRPVCEGIDLARVYGGLSNVRAEVAYALNVETEECRELGINLGRRYPVTSAAEFCGTNDIEGDRLDKIPCVEDVKTGDPVTACAENPQMLFHARARQRRTDATKVEGRIIYIGRAGQVRIDPHMFTSFELDSFEDRLVELREQIAAARARYAATGEVDVSSGDHCRHCAAMLACPKYTALARTMVTDVDAIRERIALMPPEEQAAAWVKARDVKRLVDNVIEGLKSIATQSPIQLQNGKRVGAVSYAKTDFKAELAIALLRQRGATQEEIDACFVESTVTQVRELGSSKKKLAVVR